MRYVSIAALAAALGAGCAAPSPTTAPVEPWSESRGGHWARYACGNGEEVETRAFPFDGVGFLIRYGRPMEFQQQQVSAGFLFTNGPSSIVRGKGNEITVDMAGMVPLQCHRVS